MSAGKPPTIEIQVSAYGGFTWILKASGNGAVVAMSARPYPTFDGAKRAARRLAYVASRAEIKS